MNQQGFDPYGGNRILLEDTYDIRAMARAALSKFWVPAALACFLAAVITSVPATIFDNLLGRTIDLSTVEPYKTLFENADLAGKGISLTFKVSPLSGVWTVLVTGPLTIGLMMVFMRLFRTGAIRPEETLNGFKTFGRAVLLFLFITLFLFLWALIPLAGIVLCIIAAIKYSMAFMIAVDYPNLSVSECVNVSKRMMKGNKGKFFLLQLSFIGWYILAGIVGGIAVAIFGLASDFWLVTLFAGLISSAATSVVSAYVNTANVVFYDMLNGRVPAKVVWQDGPSWQQQSY